MRLTKSTAISLLALSLLPLLRAADPAPEAAPGTPPPAKRKHTETELGDRMEEMGSAFKKLRRQVTDATQNASSLELVAKLRASAEKASKLKPEKTADVPEADRAKFVEDFQNEMKALLKQLDGLEAAFKANDNAQADKILKDIGAQQRKDHKTFQKPHD